MEWKTDSENEEMEEPYSAFKRGGSEVFGGKTRMPFIIIGCGVLVLILLFFIFNPRPPRESDSNIQSLTARLEILEKRMADLEGQRITASETGLLADAALEGSLEYQQLANWIKSNAEVISETIKKMGLLEKKLDQIQGRAQTKTEENTPRPVVEKKQAAEKKPTASAKEPVKVQAAEQPAALRYHTVQKGENLYRISLKYGVTISMLQKMNHLDDPTKIQPGQRLVVSPTTTE
jgi:LysM repeat protein